ncbi:MAG: hypothetical protein JRE24_04060 [Deltaproteobacteria bacterium]|nr:hypothetical protein [Deltaproteobacteria bacterium]
MPQIQGVKGDAVVTYCELLTTREMWYDRLSRRVNEMKIQRKNGSPPVREARTSK